MTVLHLVANSWHFWYLVLTTKPMFAPPRPVPRQLFDQLRYKTGVLVQSIKGCASFQVSTLLGIQHTATRPLARTPIAGHCGTTTCLPQVL